MDSQNEKMGPQAAASQVAPQRPKLSLLPKPKIDFSDIPGQVTHFRVFVPECKTPVGYALITHEGQEAILWNIYIEPKYRRRGLAGDLIGTLQHVYDYIITSFTSQHGKRLCERCQFVFDEKTNFLEWSKEVKDAPQKKDVECAAGGGNPPS